MIQVTSAQLWVHDQDAALEWYTKCLGFEVRADVTVPELDNYRWLTVGAPGQDEIEIVLNVVPGEPIFSEDTRERILELLSRGASGGIFLTTDDIHADYEELRARGVEFTQEPTEVPYGIDSGFRDPSGNAFRLAQRKPVAVS